MRMQIFLHDDLAQVLNDLAWNENRDPKQQAEWLLQKALKQVIQADQSLPNKGGKVTRESHV